MTALAAILWYVAIPRSIAGTGPTPAPSRASWRTPLVLGLIGLMAMTTLHVYTLVTWFPVMCTMPGSVPRPLPCCCPGSPGWD